MARATVKPPTPESKMPIGALFLSIELVAICVSVNGERRYRLTQPITQKMSDLPLFKGKILKN
jgi:hypothetical protein